MRVDVGGRQRRASAAASVRDEEGGQHSREPRQPQRRRGLRHRPGRWSRKWPLERRREVELRDRPARSRSARSSHGARSISTGASGAAASRWLASFSVAARAAEISRSARSRSGRKRPAVRHRRFRSAAARASRRSPRSRSASRAGARRSRGRRRARRSKANSVTIGTWSDGFSQLRQASKTLWPTACSRDVGRRPHMVEPPAAIRRRASPCAR